MQVVQDAQSSCEAQEKVIQWANLSGQQKGQMLSQIITYPDIALPLFEVPEYLLAQTLSAHLQGPPAGIVNSVSAVVRVQMPPPPPTLMLFTILW